MCNMKIVPKENIREGLTYYLYYFTGKEAYDTDTYFPIEEVVEIVRDEDDPGIIPGIIVDIYVEVQLRSTGQYNTIAVSLEGYGTDWGYKYLV